MTNNNKANVQSAVWTICPAELKTFKIGQVERNSLLTM